ncbi:MAG: glycosyltransferase [Candidatus Paceibacterota bacterium]|jgi:glycosyltransferase involved in cell wall biosynthesis
MPLITAIITTFNRALFLKKAVESVLAQTFENFELLVLDNSSTDNTEKIVNGFNDKRIRYIRHEPIGISAARNLGVKEAKGEFVAFLDDDDEWLPNKLQDQINIFNKDGLDTALVYGGFVWIGEKNKVIGKHLPAIKGYILKELLSQKDYFTGSASNPMIRKSVFEDIGYYDEKVLTGEDWELYLRLAQKFKIDFINKFVVKISQHSGSRLGGKLLEAAELELLVLKKYSDIFENDKKLKSLYLQKIGGKFCRIDQPKKGRAYFKKAIKTYSLNLLAYSQFFLSFFSDSFYRTIHKFYKTITH